MPKMMIRDQISIPFDFNLSLFKKPKCEFHLAVDVDELESSEQQEIFVREFKKYIEPKIEKSKKKKGAEIAKAIKETELQIQKKQPKDLRKFTATANKLIQQGLDAWASVEVRSIMEEGQKRALNYLIKKAGYKMTLRKLKYIGKVVFVLLLAGAAATATIMGTGGTALPIVLTTVGLIIAVGNTSKSVYKTYQEYLKYLKGVEKNLAKLEDAVAYQDKKKKVVADGLRSLGPKEKFKLLRKNTDPIIKNLESDLSAAADKFLLVKKEMDQKRKDAAEALKKVNALKDTGIAAADDKLKEAKKTAYDLNRAVEKYDESHGSFHDMQAQATKLIEQVRKDGTLDPRTSKVIKGAVGKLRADKKASVAFKAMSTAADIANTVVKIVDAATP